MVEFIGIAAIVATCSMAAFYYPSLPDQVPSHFNLAGEPDAYGSKSLLWILPVIAAIMYTGLAYLNRKPHVFNYPTKITEENAERQYTIATRMMRYLNTTVALAFAYITYSIVKTAAGQMTGTGPWFIILFIALTLGVPLIYLFVSSNMAKKKSDVSSID